MRESIFSTGTRCLLALSLVSSVLSQFEEVIDNKILGGSEVLIQDYPYQLALEGGNRHICGGSILTKNWALTAAHCVYGQPVGWFKFRSGSTYREQGGVLHTVVRYTFHKQYNRTTVDYDIAVVSVLEPFQFTPITLPLNGPRIGDSVTILGWGYQEPELLSKPKQLMAANVVVYDWEVCKSKYFPSLTPRMMCAGAPKHDICGGDSGGPLIRGSGQQVGISSWSYKCGQGVSVYTNVTVLFPWIMDMTGMDDIIVFPDH